MVVVVEQGLTRAGADVVLPERQAKAQIGGSKMPAKSEAQQQAAGIALAAKRGEVRVSSLRGAAKRMYINMTEEELEDFAGTKTKGLPRKVKKD